MINHNVYNRARENAYIKIKHIRNAYASRPEEKNQEIRKLIDSAIFNIGGENYSEYKFVMDEVDRRSNLMFCEIIAGLLRVYNVQATTLALDRDIIPPSLVLAIARNEGENRILYLFKKLGEGNHLNNKLIEYLMNCFRATGYKYISLVGENAFAEIINHNNDEQDPSRGTNTFSLKYFFEQFFSSDEYEVFTEFEMRFTYDVRNYLGLLITKSLTPNALFSFKKTVEYSISHFQYRQAAESLGLDHITEKQWSVIENQFLNDGLYKSMLGNRDFSQSFLTAEWLFDSMNTAGSIDFTAVAMGYFKSIEQLIFNFIMLHKDEGRTIRRKLTDEIQELFKDTLYIHLTDNYVQNEYIDSTLGSLIGFINFHKNSDLFRKDISNITRKSIKQILSQVKALRNGYFHKDNLNDWMKVDTARNTAYIIYCFLLGAYNYSDSDRKSFSIPSAKTDYYKLCEYMNFNSSQVYYFFADDGTIDTVIGDPDDGMYMDSYGDATYSGVYVHQLLGIGNRKTIVSVTDILSKRHMGEYLRYNETNLPPKIYSGNMTPCAEGMLFSGPEIKIFENGRFYGNEPQEKPKY